MKDAKPTWRNHNWTAFRSDDNHSRPADVWTLLTARKHISRETFTSLLIEKLHYHLYNQRRQPFFIAQAAITELGYKRSGRYYWIVDFRPHSPNHAIGWVSDDYHIYHDPIEHFGISMTELETRFLQKRING